jgi:hypothetical protein
MSQFMSTVPTVRGIVWTWVIVTTLSLGLVATASPVSGQAIPERSISQPPETSSCPIDSSDGSGTALVPEDGFIDVPTNSVHEFAVDCIAWYEVASGTSATTYDPGGSVQREQMASFIARLIDFAAEVDNAGSSGPGRELPPPPTDNQFPCDVSTTSTHYDNIQRLAVAGIVDGTRVNDAGNFCFDPGIAVTRSQMAAFLARAQQYVTGIATDLDSDADYFVDDDSDVHLDDIDLIAALGIARGTGADEGGRRLYSPGLDVKRDQMATFLARTLDFLVEEGETRPPQ